MLRKSIMQLIVVAHKYYPSNGRLKKDGQEFDVSLVYRVRSSLKKHSGVINIALSLVFLSFGSCLKKNKTKHFPPT